MSWLCMDQKVFIFLSFFFFWEKHHVSHISNQSRNCKRKHLVIWNWPREKLTFVGRTPAFIQMDWWEKQTRLISAFDGEMWQVILSHDSLNLLSRYHLMSFEEFWESEIPKCSLDFILFLFSHGVSGILSKHLFFFLIWTFLINWFLPWNTDL